MSSTSTGESSTEGLSRGRVVGYALGDVANNVAFMMTSLFLMAYMTDIAGVPAAIAGSIYGVTKFWAGVTDLLAGNTVGRKQTKWGRLRPWLVWGSPFLAISLVLLFSTPAGLSPTATIVWILLFDAAFQLFYSFVNIPYGSLSAAMTEDGIDRSRLAGARSIAASIAGLALSLVLSPQFEDTTADGIRLRFTTATIILAVVALVLYWLCFRNTREVVPAGTGKLNLTTTLQTVRQNKPLLVLCLGALFLLGGSFTMSAVMMYYARDVVGNATYFTWLFLCQTLGTIVAASLIAAITEKIGKRVGYVGLALVAAAGFVLVALAPTGNLLLALFAFLVFGFGYGGSTALMFSMQADTVDYGEWKTGTRAEGGSYSILSFVRKVGQGVGGFLGGAIIGGFGYAAAASIQSPSAIQGIKVAAGWAPAALCVVAAVVVWFYPLSNDEHRGIVRQLHDRRVRHAFAETEGEKDAVSVTNGALVALRPVVTINEQYGAGAWYVAETVAQRLGVPSTGPRFSSEELERAELADPSAATAAATGSSAAAFGTDGVTGFLRSLSRTTYQSDTAIAADAQADSRLTAKNIAYVTDFVRHSGGVVVGRDATVILAEMRGALHVRLEAPTRTRIARAAEAYGISTDVAAQRQQREDRMRRLMSERLMQWDPTDERRYDLVIDTSEVSLDDAVDMIVAASEAKRAT